MRLPAAVALVLALCFAPVLRAGMPERQSVLDAYKSGKVRLVVTVDKGATDGGKVHVAVESTGKEAMKLVVPKGKTVFPGSLPLETFTIEVAAEKPLDVEKDGGSSFEALQKGEFRALTGRFTLEFYEGEPQFMGSVEAGPVKER